MFYVKHFYYHQKKDLGQIRNKKDTKYIVTTEIFGVEISDKITKFGIFTITHGEK